MQCGAHSVSVSVSYLLFNYLIYKSFRSFIHTCVQANVDVTPLQPAVWCSVVLRGQSKRICEIIAFKWSVWPWFLYTIWCSSVSDGGGDDGDMCVVYRFILLFLLSERGGMNHQLSWCSCNLPSHRLRLYCVCTASPAFSIGCPSPCTAHTQIILNRQPFTFVF